MSAQLENIDRNLTDEAEKSTKGIERLELHLDNLGKWKFNEINGCTYHQPIGGKKWEAYDKRLNRTIRRNLKKEYGWPVSNDYLDDIVLSDFSEPFNPVQAYFEDLPEYTGSFGNPISQLASCLTTHIGAKFETYLKKWLVASVANVFTDHRCTNHQCLTLLGDQGDGKSTFLEKINPPGILEYCYSGSIKFENDVDVNIKLSQNFIVHIEETLGDLMARYENQIKEFITRNKCLYVRKYANEQKLWPRMANVCASLNASEFLTDITGDRRYLVFRVLNINLDALAEINVNHLWAQAYFLFTEGYQYWFNEEENVEIQKNNEQFRVVSEEQEMLTKMFNLHLNQDSTLTATHRYTATDLANLLKKESPNYKISKLSVGKALRRMGCKNPQESSTGVRYYYLSPVKMSDDENKNPTASTEVQEKYESARREAKLREMQDNAKQQDKDNNSNSKIKPNDNFQKNN